ncbi:glutathione-dependent formaldehyde-activating [Heterostelium album PN500]|uniref:Glutathione-dependent formaldehyde-activating n=1 Tax=Heterostelium pallidum (strain ATCC 26659 / Pp 5 / PN500) TaxID=670386 RepID=D3BTZ6_HETP5|nr:glutathione-dependent formaldehyde-activating [Heterostelium album PN500]EFA75182.1 glutathione-dependent formaldehyde-activating [Heterostelium album PN500]|eukprot:XP_020427316.1 glutathione-dependent formaldehyde-activating [Heterostelium album PN500]
MNFNLPEGKHNYIGSCECGDIRISAELDLNKIEAEHCNCSLCLKDRSYSTRADISKFKLLSGAESTTLYDFGTNTIDHYLCKICGTKVYSYCKIPTIGEYYSVSIPCIKGITEEQLTTLPDTKKGFSDYGIYKGSYPEKNDFKLIFSLSHRRCRNLFRNKRKRNI